MSRWCEVAKRPHAGSASSRHRNKRGTRPGKRPVCEYMPPGRHKGMRSLQVFAATALLSAGPLAAQGSPPSPDSLAGIAERGRLLAEYDQAAWHATDAVALLNPGDDEIRGYIAQRRDGKWTVSFGRMSDDGNAYLVAYDARENASQSNGFVVTRHAPARRETGDLAGAARALDVTRTDFGTPTRSYNSAVIPAGNGEWFVYLVPAQTRPGIFPLGGDVRYRVSSDGRNIKAKRRLHNTILEFATPKAPGSSVLTAKMHTAVLDNVPEDTDVFHVLAREPKVPEDVATDTFIYRIDVSGKVVAFGLTKDVIRPDGTMALDSASKR